MGSAEFTALGVFTVLIVTGLGMQFCMGLISRKLYTDHRWEWERCGAPGGLLWRPPGRSVVENLRLTQSFWAKHVFDFGELKAISPELHRVYRLNQSLLAIGAVLIVVGVPLLHFYASRRF